MHHCLRVAEISHEIIEYLLECNSFRDTRRHRNLLAVALTCKQLCEPALDVLWKSQTSLVPLLKCIPGSEWKKERRSYTDSWTLCSPIKPADWVRLEYYSKKIRSLDLSGGLRDLNDGLCGLLTSSLSCDSLIPVLKDLTWNVSSSSALSYAKILIGPSLQTLRLTFGSSEPAYWLSFFPVLPHLAPNVLTFDLIYRGGTSNLIAKTDFSYFRLWTSLISVKLGGPSTLRSAAISELAYLPNLRELVVLGYGHDTEVTIMNQPGKSKRLPSLDSLEMSSSPLSIISFLNTLKKSGIQTLRLTAEYNEYSEERLPASSSLDWSKLSKAITSACSPSELREITIRDDIQDYIFEEETGAIPSFLPSYMAPLLAFKKLEKVQISLHKRSVADITDSSIECWTAAWPSLTHFKLSHEVEYIEPQASLFSLSYFARNCPKIQRIHLAVDARKVPSLEQTFDLPRSLCRVDWEAVRSPVRNAADVASFLAIIFPNIQGVSGSMRSGSWDEIGKLVILCTTVGQHFEQRARREMKMLA